MFVVAAAAAAEVAKSVCDASDSVFSKCTCKFDSMTCVHLCYPRVVVVVVVITSVDVCSCFVIHVLVFTYCMTVDVYSCVLLFPC